MSHSSEQKLLKTVENELLANPQTLLLERESGLRAMLANDSLIDLSRLFRLYSRVHGGLEAIAEMFRLHVVRMGHDKIELRVARLNAFSESAGKPQDKDKESQAVASDDPQFIKDFIAVHDKYLCMVREQFSSHALFQKALNDAFHQLVNQDPNTSTQEDENQDKEAPAAKEKTADLIATFCDRLLKSGSVEKLDDTEIENHLEKTAQLFSYLIDKDVFAEIYKNQLAKR